MRFLSQRLAIVARVRWGWPWFHTQPCPHDRGLTRADRAGRPVSGIAIAFRQLTPSGERQKHIEREISEKMRRDIGQEVAVFHVSCGENAAQHKRCNDTA